MAELFQKIFLFSYVIYNYTIKTSLINVTCHKVPNKHKNEIICICEYLSVIFAFTNIENNFSDHH